jgi:L-lysine 6-transaminase
MNDDEILAMLRPLILPLAEDHDATLSLSAKLEDDLGMDSLSQVDCLISIEREFGITVTDEAATSLTEVGAIVDYIRANVRRLRLASGVTGGYVSTDNAALAERAASTLDPNVVYDQLRKHLPAPGLPLVWDPDASKGSWLVDARTGKRYLDLYTFFASAPLGHNPPEIVEDYSFLAELGATAVNKPANSDLYSVQLAEFISTFLRVLGDSDLPRLFFIEGGALAVETALKCAFDWKSRRNEAAGRSRDLGTKVMHLRHAFHGRSGYTLSLTNTDPVKTDRFPQFDWPRIDSPAIRFPCETHLADVITVESTALAQAEAAFASARHDIACFIVEPIQCEGGDRHLRPEFLHSMQELCHRYDSLFIVDEVQTGGGVTGSPWAYMQLGLKPDIVAFSKKLQVGGIMAGRRVLDEPANVFEVPGRISSTWGGGLVDMVRSRRYLEIIERDDLIPRALSVGARFLSEIRELGYPDILTNVRGRGLLIAFDLPTGSIRDYLLRYLLAEEHILALPAGDQSVRLRPALNIREEELEITLTALGRALRATAMSSPGHGS